MKNKIVLSGYYGFDNAGDEAVMASIIQGLREENDRLPLVVLSHQPEKTERDWLVEARDRWDLKEVWRLFGESSVLISGGGSLLQDVTGIKSLIYYLGVILMAKLRHNQIIIFAQGIGPIRSGFGRKLTGMILHRSAYISVRDENSALDLVDMGIPQERIHVTVDPCLAWQYRSVPIPLPSGAKIGFSVRHWSGADKKVFADVADGLVKKGYQVVFLPFHWPQDRDFSLEIIETMEHQSQAFLVDQCLSPQTMMATIRQMDMMVSMRLHGLIMAAATGVPGVAISYDPKVTSFAHGLDMPLVEDLASMTAAEILAACSQVLEELPERKEALNEKQGQWQKAYRETIKAVVDLWKKE